MSALSLSVRIVLAALFAVAAIAKWADLSGSRGALEDFGAPQKLARIGGTVLPVFELLIATCLLIVCKKA